MLVIVKRELHLASIIEQCFDNYSCAVTSIDESSLKNLPFRKPLVVKENKPKIITKIADGKYFIAFDTTVFGELELRLQGYKTNRVKVKIAELANETLLISKDAGYGSAFYQEFDLLAADVLRVRSDSKKGLPTRNDLPDGIESTVPFRFVEVEGDPDLVVKDATQFAVTYPISRYSSSFQSSDSLLNRVWDVSKETLIATSFARLYVDGNRERTPYEADARIAQLSHYYTDADFTLARATLVYLLENPSWPIEWAFTSIFMAYSDYKLTNDKEFLSTIFPKLKKRLFEEAVRPDGLLEMLPSNHLNLDGKALSPIIDWPAVERNSYDVVSLPYSYSMLKLKFKAKLLQLRSKVIGLLGYKNASLSYSLKAESIDRSTYLFHSVNTVVNAYFFQALKNMSFLANELGLIEDGRQYLVQSQKLKESMIGKLSNPSSGLFVDGLESRSSSVQANVFTLAFGLVPKANMAKVVEFLEAENFSCSIYCYQYLLEGLFKEGYEERAIKLLTGDSYRSWIRVMDLYGLTLTPEAWDPALKPNMDWSHVWGASPANVIPRFFLGIRPTKRSRNFEFNPKIGTTEYVKAKVPTPFGGIHLHIDGGEKSIHITVPERLTLTVDLTEFCGVSGKETSIVSCDSYWNGRCSLQSGVYNLKCNREVANSL